jgi:hypothetical protein
MPPAAKSTAMHKAPSVNRLDTNTGPPGLPHSVRQAAPAAQTVSAAGAGDVVPKVLFDEKLQELLAKDDMIQVCAIPVNTWLVNA